MQGPYYSTVRRLPDIISALLKFLSRATLYIRAEYFRVVLRVRRA